MIKYICIKKNFERAESKSHIIHRFIKMDKNEKEKKIYGFLCEFIRENGYSPTVREIAAACGISSTSTVHSYIRRLRDKGLVTSPDFKKRSLRTARDGRIPIVGRVAAGAPIYAEENITGYIPSPEPGCFALEVRGESMINAGINDGDHVIVRPGNTADDGDIIVALIDDEATVKRFYREKDVFRLQPENDTMTPIYTKELCVLGKVIYVVRHVK